MNLPLRTVFVLISVMLWAAELSSAQSGGISVPAPAASPATQEGGAPPHTPQVAAPEPDQAEASSNPQPNNAPSVSAPAEPPPAGSRIAARPQNAKDRKGKEAPAPTDSPSDEAKPYVIGSLDILEIKVWNDQKLSGIFDVRPDGILSLPLIGELKADGLTVPELTRLITAKLAANVMEDPEVNIQVARINSKKFYIFGGVLHPGEFPLVGPMTVLDAFASCGGFKDFANLKKIYLLRGTERLSFNYKEVSQGKHMEQNRRLQNGDRIFVPE